MNMLESISELQETKVYNRCVNLRKDNHEKGLDVCTKLNIHNIDSSNVWHLDLTPSGSVSSAKIDDQDHLKQEKRRRVADISRGLIEMKNDFFYKDAFENNIPQMVYAPTNEDQANFLSQFGFSDIVVGDIHYATHDDFEGFMKTIENNESMMLETINKAGNIRVLNLRKRG